MKNTGDATPLAEQGTDMIPVIRNMSSRTKSQPCTCVHCTFGRDLLAVKQNLAGDLASHMFGNLVSTEVARNILTTFITDGVVQVFEGVIPHDEKVSEPPLDSHSEDVQHALAEAFEAATAHGCVRMHPEGNAPRKSSLSANQERMKGGKTYSFRWCTFPKEPFGEHELVSFLNELTDRAFAAAEPHFTGTTTKLKLRHRFAVPEDKCHAVRLTYDPDQENIRPPHFLLLPVEAFSGGNPNTVLRKYVNFSAARLVGVSSEDPAAGLEETQWYAQSLKYAQPWVYYVLAMTFSLDTVIFSRVDGSDWEHLVLMLWNGRGCIDFIRILLGLVLADDVDLGQNPDIVLGFEERTFQLDNLRHSVPLDAVSSTADSHFDDGGSDDVMSATSHSSSCHSAPASLYHKALEKRHHSEIGEEDDNEDDPQLKKYKIIGVV